MNCYTQGNRRERLFYTVKEWNKFKIEIQEELSVFYEVILTNHFTFKEKLKRFFSRRSPEVRKRNKEKIARGFAKFKKLMDQFSNGMSKLHFEGGSDANMNKLTGGFNKASGVDHNFGVLTGHNKTRRKFRGRKGQGSSDPYSALTDGNDRDFRI